MRTLNHKNSGMKSKNLFLKNPLGMMASQTAGSKLEDVNFRKFYTKSVAHCGSTKSNQRHGRCHWCSQSTRVGTNRGQTQHHTVAFYLSSSQAKLVEDILICRLTKFTETHNTLTENHFGTRPDRQIHDTIYCLLCFKQQHITARSCNICRILWLFHRVS